MEDIKMAMQELKIDPFRKFNAAFALMTVIPFLVFFYLLAVRLFTLNIFIGNITKDIIEMHKGRIWAENLQGAGNRFIVVLPRDLRGKLR